MPQADTSYVPIRFIRHLSRQAYGRYPLPTVQDAEDIANQIVLLLIEYVERRGSIPKKTHIENKCRFLCRDVMRKNNRFGFSVRRHDRVPAMGSLDADTDSGDD